LVKRGWSSWKETETEGTIKKERQGEEGERPEKQRLRWRKAMKM
jgi:hypothetical protein